MSYYDLTVDRIPFGRKGPPQRIPTNNEPWLGVYCAPMLFDEAVKSWNDEHGEEDKDNYLYSLKIRDNGKHGFGVSICVYAPCDRAVFEGVIPLESVDTIIETLQAIKRLRESE